MASICRRLTLLKPMFRHSATWTIPPLSTLAPPGSARRLQVPKPQTVCFPRRSFAVTQPLTQKKTVTIHFLMQDGDKQSVQAKLGDNLLDVIIDNDVEVDGFGACEGTLACSTCHLIFNEDNYSKISEPPTDEELDMLDLAYGLEDTSRLGCQVIVTSYMDGWEIKVPQGTADAREP